jgi:transposase
VINAICWVERTGSPWRDLPERYGPWKTPYQRFRRWAANGTWARLKAEVVTLADGRGRSLASRITPGQAADTRQLIPLLDQVRVATPGPGRPRKRPAWLTGDRAYSSRANRQALRDRHITTTIPQPRDQIANRLRKGRNGGRPPAFGPAAYKGRNQVERGFNRRKHWRGFATRYDKLGTHFQTTLGLVEMLDWLRAVPDALDLRDRA